LDTRRDREPSRRDVIAGGSAAALGITVLALPTGAAASSIPVALSYTAPTGGVVYGWGPDAWGGVFGTQTGTKLAPVEVTGASFTWPEIVQVLVSNGNSIALAGNGDVYVSGSNEYGKIGTTAVAISDSAETTTPQRADISDVVHLASGTQWVLAVKSSGQVWAWGQANAASGLTALTRTPADVTSVLWPSSPPTGTDRVMQLASSPRHSIALTVTGRVFTWGTQSSGSEGVLGQGGLDPVTSSTAAEIGGAFAGTDGGADRIIQVSAGTSHSLALGRDGSVYAWGKNDFFNNPGALGTGDETSRGAPVDISEVGALANTVGTDRRIVQVVAGNFFSLAVGLDGAVYAWGRSIQGRLGDGTVGVTSLSPKLITGIAGSALPLVTDTSRRIVQVAASRNNGFALGADGRVYGWGAGGVVGDGTSDGRLLPVEITAAGAFANLSPNPGATLGSRRIVALATSDESADSMHMLAIDDRG
jgi:alpha-tubulin suppressor-like RCC1 family protein